MSAENIQTYRVRTNQPFDELRELVRNHGLVWNEVQIDYGHIRRIAFIRYGRDVEVLPIFETSREQGETGQDTWTFKQLAPSAPTLTKAFIHESSS